MVRIHFGNIGNRRLFTVFLLVILVTSTFSSVAPSYVSHDLNKSAQKESSIVPNAYADYLSQFGSFGSGNGQFDGAIGIAIDSSDNVYVVDNGNGRVQIFDSSGVYQSQFGSAGAGNGQFIGAQYVALDSSGNIYVTDTGNSRVQKFSSTGAYISQFGSLGSGNGQFNALSGIAIDSSDNIYVADTSNNRVQIFDSAGNYLSQFGASGSGNGQFTSPIGITLDNSGNIYVVDEGNNRVQKFSPLGAYISQFGSSGSGNGQFTFPRDITLDSAGNIYVVDGGNHRVQKFNSAGGYISQFGSLGSGTGQFSGALGIALDSSGNIYVSDFSNNNVQKFSPVVESFSQFGTPGSANGQFDVPFAIAINSTGYMYVVDTFNNRVQIFNAAGSYVSQFGSVGSGNGQFANPTGIAIDTSGNIYVSDQSNNRVQKFSPTGVYISQFGSSGSGNGQFNGPYGITIDISTGNIYVADSSNNRIQIFDSSGVYQSQFGTSGSGNGQFNIPVGVKYDGATAKVYVVENSGNRVQKFSPTGVYISQFGSSGSGNGQFTNPTSIVLDGSGNIYVTDTNNNRVQEFDSSGVYQSQFGTSGSGVGQLGGPDGILFDKGNVYVTEGGNGRVQKFSSPDSISLDKTTYSMTDTAQITLISRGSNIDPSLVNILNVLVNSTSANPSDGILVPVVETGINTGMFVGTFDFTSGASTGATLHAIAGDAITVLDYVGHGATATATINPSTSIEFDRLSYTTNHDPAFITITDPTANTNTLASETVVALVNSTSNSTITPVTLTETGPDTGIFFGSVTISTSPSSAAVPNVQANGGDTLDALYLGVEASASILPDAGIGILSSTTFPIVLDPFVVYPESHGAIRVTDTTSWNSAVPTITAHISSTTSSGFNVQLTRDIANPGSYRSNMITFTAIAGATADSTNLILPIPSIATPKAVTATYGSSIVRADVLLPPTPQSVVNPVTTVGLTCAAGDDRDNDGICDSWETATGLVIPYNGITFSVSCNHSTYDSVNDPLNAHLCPDSGKPDVYVQISWMDGHYPDTVALKNVVSSFNNAPVTNAISGESGINLHILIDSISMPFAENIPIDGSLVPTTGFRQLKADYLLTSSDRAEVPVLPPGYSTMAQAMNDIATAKRQVFHYSAYIHNLSDAPGSSGWGEIGGNDFVISLGSFTGQVGSQNQQAGTFMHELGHNLYLNHGGPGTTSFNCKPVDLSVMNYLYQFNAQNGGFLTTRPLDYSEVRVTYAETQLNEQTGIDAINNALPGSVNPQNIIIGGVTTDASGIITHTFSPITVTTGGPVDFNQNHVTTDPVYAQNTHYFGIPDCTDTGIKGSVGGFNEWASLDFNFRDSSTFTDGVFTQTSNEVTNPALDDGFEHEISAPTVQQIATDSGVIQEPPSPITLSPTVNAGSDVTITEGSTLTRTGSIDDPISSSFTGTVDYGSGVQALTITGNTFALSHMYPSAGTFHVMITINNDRGGTSTSSFTVTVTGMLPTQQISNLVGTINGLNLAKGTATSLVSKLNNANAILNDGDPSNDMNACSILHAFENEVKAQSGKKINSSDANSLIVSVKQIETALGC